MKIFLNWICETDSLEIIDRFRQTDLEIFDLSITQKEGEIAICQLTIPLNAPLEKEGYALISFEKEGKRIPIFKGRLMELPIHMNDMSQKIELFALPCDAFEQLQTLRQEIQQTEDWDDLFVSEEAKEDPVEALEAIPSLFSWHPVTHKVTLSNVFQGKTDHTYQESDIFHNSLVLRIANLPKPYIQVSLIAEWVQESQGDLNLFPHIEKKFKGSKINTLTAKSILAAWPRTGQFLGRSGYFVTKSSLVPFIPGSTGILGLYPQVTPEIHLTNEKEKRVHLKQSWFVGSLKMGWTYRQRRREIVQFKMTHKNQLTQRMETKKLHLTLKLEDINKDLSYSSNCRFFETDRGRKAITHAMKIARCHLALSARGVEAIFKVPFDQGISLTMDDSIHLIHPSIPQGQIVGKLISYQLFASFETKWAELKIAIATGQGIEESPPSYQLNESSPLLGIFDEHNLTTHDFIEEIQIKNEAEDQIRLFSETPLSTREDLSQFLEKNQTEIVIKLKDIRSTDVLERRFSLDSPIVWSAPCQININRFNKKGD